MNEMTKKEMAQEICNRLNGHGLIDMDAYWNDHAYEIGSGFGAKLLYMPEENLAKMLECDVQDWSDFTAVSNAWGRAGALRFQPYVVSEGERDNPSLVIRYNRYLHMFRGYHFQASGSIDGHGDCGSGSYRTDFMARAAHYNYVSHDSLLAYLLWWAAMIDVGFKFDNFIDLYNTDKSVLEGFLKESIHYWTGPTKFGWKDIEPYIRVEKGNIDIYTRTMYQITRKSGDIGAYLAIGEKTVQVETAGCNLVTIEIPDPIIGTEYDMDDEDSRDDFEREMNGLRKQHYHEMLLVMAAKLAGIELNFMGSYFLWKQEYLKPINAPGVISVRDLNQIYGVELDQY